MGKNGFNDEWGLFGVYNKYGHLEKYHCKA
jgi:hypothetical protein